jgi:hypothetical protein
VCYTLALSLPNLALSHSLSLSFSRYLHAYMEMEKEYIYNTHIKRASIKVALSLSLFRTAHTTKVYIAVHYVFRLYDFRCEKWRVEGISIRELCESPCEKNKRWHKYRISDNCDNVRHIASERLQPFVMRAFLPHGVLATEPSAYGSVYRK